MGCGNLSLFENFTEDLLEQAAIEILQELDYSYAFGPDIAYDGDTPERNNYKDVLVENGLKVAGFNPERNLVEIVEIEDHPYYVGCQFHPEFTSRPNRAQPLFQGLISAAHDRKYNK